MLTDFQNCMSTITFLYSLFLSVLINFFRMTGSLKMKYSSFIRFFLICTLFGSLLISSGFLFISSNNYPGGYAFDRLHRLENGNNSLSVHICVEAAMSGVSRFGEFNDNWRYFFSFSKFSLRLFILSFLN